MDVKKIFSGNRSKVIIAAVAAVLIIGVAAGVIAHNAGSSKGAIASSLSSSSQSSDSTPDDTSSRAAALIAQERANVASQDAESKAASSEAALASKPLNITVGGKSSSSSSVVTGSPNGGKPAAASSSAAVPVASVDFTQHAVTLTVGRTYQLTANITPGNASNQSLAWTSTNNAVASVNSSGGVTAKAPGTALIRATATNGQRDTCTVTVVSANTGGSTGSSGGSAGGSTGGNTSGSAGKGISGVTLPSSPAVIDKGINKEFNGVISTLYPGSHGIQLGVNTSSVNKTGGDLYLKVYENGTLWKSGLWGTISGGDASDGATVGLDAYTTGGYWWEKPASYRIECYKGSLSGSPFETISFSVSELGFTS